MDRQRKGILVKPLAEKLLFVERIFHAVDGILRQLFVNPDPIFAVAVVIDGPVRRTGISSV